MCGGACVCGHVCVHVCACVYMDMYVMDIYIYTYMFFFLAEGDVCKLLGRAMSSASQSSNPSLRIIHHSSSVQCMTDVNMCTGCEISLVV